MNARAAVFDLYGDHLRHRGGEAAIAGVIRILEALDIAGPAVRTAVSRMARQGWLAAYRSPAGPGYRLTPKADRRLEEAAVRIFGKQDLSSWDGRWSVLVVQRTSERSRRERLQRGLEYLGYRVMDGAAWVSPRRSVEAASTVDAEGLSHDEFSAEFAGDSAELVDRLYDLTALATSYEHWLALARGIVAAGGDDADPRAAFATRSLLLHEWRKFLFRDPGLPVPLLPADWPGFEARRYFDENAERLLPGARAFVADCLDRRI